MSDVKHFIDMRDISAADLRSIIDNARNMKGAVKQGTATKYLQDKKLAMIFEKNSTRTRSSFEAGMYDLGGHVINLNAENSQLGRGESVSDTAKVLARYVDVMMMRANEHGNLLELAENSSVPVINGLTDKSHPCQIMADVLTIEEHLGVIKGKRIAWVGDGNNVAHSFIAAAVKFDFTLVLSMPKKLSVEDEYVEWASAQEGGTIILEESPEEAVTNADVVVTDTWVSMGDTNKQERMELLQPYQVNSDLMERAKEDAIFMHCLPAHRGEEVTAGVIDGPQSVVWDEAENRLHAQKAILCWCLGV